MTAVGTGRHRGQLPWTGIASSEGGAPYRLLPQMAAHGGPVVSHPEIFGFQDVIKN